MGKHSVRRCERELRGEKWVKTDRPRGKQTDIESWRRRDKENETEGEGVLDKEAACVLMSNKAAWCRLAEWLRLFLEVLRLQRLGKRELTVTHLSPVNRHL